jgi:hypothetical protein
MLKETIEKVKATICLKDFVVKHVLEKNVTVHSPEILKEHLYTPEELLVVFNINCKYKEDFLYAIENIYPIKINNRIYCSLFVLLNNDELLHKISPLSNFVKTIKI